MTVWFLKSKCQCDLTSDLFVSHMYRATVWIFYLHTCYCCGIPPISAALIDFRGHWHVEYWQWSLLGYEGKRRKQKGIMQASWSQATLHSSMLPLTDMNKRNQLDLLGCYPRDFHYGKGSSESKHLERKKNKKQRK